MYAYPWGYAHVVKSPAGATEQHAWQIVAAPLWARLQTLQEQLHLNRSTLHELRSLAIDDLDFRLPPWLGVEPMYSVARPEVLIRLHVLPVATIPARASTWVGSVYLPMVLPTVLDVFERGVGESLGVLARLFRGRSPISSRGGPREER